MPRRPKDPTIPPKRKGSGPAVAEDKRRERGQLRRTLRLSNEDDVSDWNDLEELHGGPSAVAAYLLKIYRER